MSEINDHLGDIYTAIDRAYWTGEISEQLADELEIREVKRCIDCYVDLDLLFDGIDQVTDGNL